MATFASSHMQIRGHEKVFVMVRGGDGRCADTHKCFAYAAAVPFAAYRAGSYLERLEPVNVKDVHSFVRQLPPEVGCIALSGFAPGVKTSIEKAFHTRTDAHGLPVYRLERSAVLTEHIMGSTGSGTHAAQQPAR
ncbi:Uncharacterised protein [uncultured archaeon]|nr:Uncharacterised protein [uncultured archaeon]